MSSYKSDILFLWWFVNTFETFSRKYCGRWRTDIHKLIQDIGESNSYELVVGESYHLDRYIEEGNIEIETHLDANYSNLR